MFSIVIETATQRHTAELGAADVRELIVEAIKL